jgi:hypothetical protein
MGSEDLVERRIEVVQEDTETLTVVSGEKLGERLKTKNKTTKKDR